MTELPVWFEVGSLAVVLVLLIGDLLLVARRPHVPSTRECTLWVCFYVGLAVLFGLAILLIPGGGAGPAGEFYAGWITEYSLSVDNLFVFILLIARFGVPDKVQQVAIMGGIIIALVLRGVFILVGAAAISRFSWVFFLFGAFLIYTAVKLVIDKVKDEGDDEYEENALVRRLRTVLPLTKDFHGRKVVVREGGRRMFTPLLIVFIALGSTDLLFALDSIPAIFGLTQDPFLVFATNLFALMGLRQLYFLLGSLLDRLVYLSYGLAAILGFIGVKLVLEALHDNELPFINGGEHLESIPAISTWVSLAVILGILAITTVASLLRSRSLGGGDGPGSDDGPSGPRQVGTDSSRPAAA